MKVWPGFTKSLSHSDALSKNFFLKWSCFAVLAPSTMFTKATLK